MRTIYKFPLNGFSLQFGVQKLSADIQVGAKFIAVNEQDDLPCVYAIVNNENLKEPREFMVYGTGHPIDNPFIKYIGTCQIDYYVAHVFEVVK